MDFMYPRVPTDTLILRSSHLPSSCVLVLKEGGIRRCWLDLFLNTPEFEAWLFSMASVVVTVNITATIICCFIAMVLRPQAASPVPACRALMKLKMVGRRQNSRNGLRHRQVLSKLEGEHFRLSVEAAQEARLAPTPWCLVGNGGMDWAE